MTPTRRTVDVVNHLELADLWNSAHTAWADDQPGPAALDRWRECYSGTGASAIDELAMPEPWTGDLTSKPEVVALGIHPGTADPAFHHRGGAFPNVIHDQLGGSYSEWASPGPYFGSLWKSAHGTNAQVGHRLRFMSAWTGVDLTPAQVVEFPVFPWHTAKWNSGAFHADPDIVREYVLEPIASTGATWAFGFGKDWWELIEALNLPILDRLGDGGRPYPTQVDHRRWLVAEGPDGLRIAAMRLDSMPIPPNLDETRDLRRVLENGPAGDNQQRSMPLAVEIEMSAQLRDMDISYINITRLLHAIDDAELHIDAWGADTTGDGVALSANGTVVVTVQAAWADFATTAPSGSSVTPRTKGAHRLPLPVATTSQPRVPKKEAKPLGHCTTCYNVLNPDRSCPMECDQ